jgi:NAD(P)-dependent dehydrogenase (short-subunit alcohol dehydrogenase family)
MAADDPRPSLSLTLPRRVLVTGAAGGIGAACVRLLTACGADVIASDLRRPAGATASGPGAVHWVEADLCVAADRRRLVAAIGPGLDGVVQAAGVIDGKPWTAIDEADIDRILSVNLKAPLLLARELGGSLADGAAVVLVGSIAARRASPNAMVYAASKAALHSVAASLALALAPRGIRVNVAAPGLIDTALTDGLNARLAREAGTDVATMAARRAADIPLGRLGTPDDVARLCLFLLSSEAAYLDAASVFATGGALAGST